MWCSFEALYVYRIFIKKHFLFDDRFTKSMCMAISMMSSFTMAFYTRLLLPVTTTVFYLIPLVIGLFIGWKFGAMIKAPASLNGIYNGAIGGIMGMMFGAVLQNPALCKIPIETEAMIVENMYILAFFIACLHALVCQLVRYSFRV